MYHISDLKRYLRCPMLYFKSLDETTPFNTYLRNDESMNDLLAKYFDIKEYYLGIRNDSSDRILKEIDNYDYFFRPRLSDEELRINIPLLEKNKDGFVVYFIVYGNQIKELDTITYSTSLQILEKNNIKVKDIKVIYLNPSYLNEGTLNIKELFVVTNEYRNKKIIDIVKNRPFNYQDIISKLNEENEIKPIKNKNCRLNGLCQYYYSCFEKEEETPDDSILTLVSSRYKNKMYEDGIQTLKDADLSLLEGSRIQYAQIMASKNEGLFLDKLALKHWLDKIAQRPISFIDFEWDRYLIPIYPKMKPLDVVCFEFALYYIDENGKMEHRTFIGKGDCRKEFVEALIDYLPKKGPILAYNALGAECLRLEELAQIYPEYQDELTEIISRFVDLATPFLEGFVYDIRMKGNYTLKKLVDICSNYNYKNLDISDGMEAVYSYRNIDKVEGEEKILEDLRQYCSLDAYGLFLVYKWLVKLTNESIY